MKFERTEAESPPNTSRRHTEIVHTLRTLAVVMCLSHTCPRSSARFLGMGSRAAELTLDFALWAKASPAPCESMTTAILTGGRVVR